MATAKQIFNVHVKEKLSVDRLECISYQTLSTGKELQNNESSVMKYTVVPSLLPVK